MMSPKFLEKFCMEPFWNNSNFWNEDNPEFTSCFLWIIPIWIPCLFIILTSPCYVFYLHKIKCHRRVRSASFAFKLKVIISMSLLLTNVACLIYQAITYFSGASPLASVISLCIMCIAFATSLLIITVEQKKQLVTSAYLFIFYLLLSICMIFYSIVHTQTRNNHNEDWVTYILHISAFICYSFQVHCMFLLMCFANSDAVRAISKKVSPEWKASWLCRLMYTWIIRLLIKGYKHCLSIADLWVVDRDLESSHCRTYFNRLWSSNRSSLLLPLVRMFAWKLSLSYAFMMVVILCLFIVPLLLSVFIEFFNNPSAPVWNGVVIAIMFFVIYWVESICFQHMTYLAMKVNYGVTSTLTSVIYDKLMNIDLNSKQSLISSKKFAHFKKENNKTDIKINKNNDNTDNSSLAATTTGEILNLLSTDIFILGDLFMHSYLVWATPLQIVLVIVILWYLLDIAIFIFICIIIVVILIIAGTSYFLKTFQLLQMKWKDKRLKLLDEIINNIKLLKLYTWETVFEKKLTDLRSKELKSLKKFFYLNNINVAASLFVPNLVTFATFTIYSMYVGPLDARIAFTSFSLFGLLQFQLLLSPIIITLIVKGRVSLKRLEKFLKLPVRSSYVKNVEFDDAHNFVSTSLSISSGSFKWFQEGPLVLNDINFQVLDQSLVAIVGQVGSGKSAILSAILGDLHWVSGHVQVKGQLGYVSQQAWILNASIRDNILLGQPYNKEKFDEVIHACALMEDVMLLSDGEMTEIGEKGINLSGGQKQRVSLARSIYQDSDVYLFDDPLSAVDSHVAKHIFDNIIGPHGMLKDKTRLLVTHAMDILPQVDQVVVLDGGRVVEQGTYQELLDNGEYLIRVLQSIHKQTSQNNVGEVDEDNYNSGNDIGEVEDIKLEILGMDGTSKEDIHIITNPEVIGKVTWSAYKFYVQLLKCKWAIFMVTCFITFKIFQIISYICVTRWTSDQQLFQLYNKFHHNTSVTHLTNNDYANNITVNISNESIRNINSNSNESNIARNSDDGVDSYLDGVKFYICRYALLLFGHAIFILLYCMARVEASMNASERLHLSMARRVIRSTMNFFYNTPTGRIMNRFSKDLDAVDNTLPDLTHQWLCVLTSLVATIVVVTISVPAFIAVALLLLVLFLALQHFYLPTVCQLKWLSSNSRSPLYSHVCETVDGLTSLRAFNKQTMFMEKFDKLVNDYTVYGCAINAADRWLAIQLEFIGALVTLSAAVFSIVNRLSLTGSLVGYYMAATIQDSFSLCYLIRIHSSLETTMVSLERMEEYLRLEEEAVDDDGVDEDGGDQVDEEDGDKLLKSAKSMEHKVSSKIKPFKYGRIELKNYSMKYRDDLEHALKHVNLVIKAREKVGLMGRTGAGKSSFIAALFRFNQSEGSIYIDDHDISKLTLKTLRSNITVLSQDPVIFSDTIRMNLDPTSLHSDDANIWQALEHVNMDDVIKSLPGQLNYWCEAGGSNFSVGQRQMICLARTLLHKSSILILDEATAAVDVETDKLIQSTISKEFRDCTVITIAHRLSAVAHCDRILHMEQGTLKDG